MGLVYMCTVFQTHSIIEMGETWPFNSVTEYFLNLVWYIFPVNWKETTAMVGRASKCSNKQKRPLWKLCSRFSIHNAAKTHTVIVSSDYHTKIPDTGQLKEQTKRKVYFSWIWKVGDPRSRFQLFCFCWGFSSWLVDGPHSRCAVPWQRQKALWCLYLCLQGHWSHCWGPHP